MNALPLKHIAICGAGLAGTLCAATLAHLLPDEIKLSFVDIPGSDETDTFFGNVTSPAIYDFLLGIGITEPELLPTTNTAFSLGTQYINWGANKRSWIQSFHKPLPIFQGVEFHQYLTRLRRIAPEAKTQNLYTHDRYIMSAHAARGNVFAHPPEDKKTPLHNMEYGYHFSPKDWCELLSRHLKNSRITKLNGDIRSIERTEGRISSITLSDGRSVEAELYIDCTGFKSKICHSKIQSDRHLKAASSFISEDKTGNICRQLTGTDYGWHSETSLQNGRQCLTVYDLASEKAALTAHGKQDISPVEATLGRLEQPWQGNCLAIGHSAAVLEPLTPAPMMLLQRDLERLVELIPHTENMNVEAREYNRRFTEDYSHASIFQRGFFEDESPGKSAYWKAAIIEPINQKLENKITQFHSRGTSVQYDLEPFFKEDWIQQHFGMGRTPRRYDSLADRANEQQIMQTFSQLRMANEALAMKMPPYHIYMKKLLEYFRKKNG